MKDNLQFRVSAELKNILGRDLITSPDIAILELVKNSYDAHATKVEITFNDDYIAIADNGKGMSKDDLINKWLFVAYSAKSDGTEDKSYRSNFKRHYAGVKGIGRMSCDRLARNLTLTTHSDESKTEMLHVDWSVFEKNRQTEFDTVDIPHETLETIPHFPLGYTTGTILEFTGLHTLWSRDDIKRLRKSLEKMINPFSGTDDNFQIEIIAPEMINDDSQIESKHDKVNGIIENSIADVLKLKTTQIESHIQGGNIHTVLRDRGILMYEIEEPNIDFSQLDSASVSLFFLNRAAKYNFSAKMGVAPVSYGNVFLFRNGFRILPYGNWNDDSWGLNQRQQQGYNRFLGTRDLFGRVDIETDNPELIKEVSSRDGGLIETDASRQLMNYFTLIHRRLERYVVGVLWGEGFLRKEYFVSQGHALDARKQLEGDKDSDSAKHLYSNIGSKVDFLQLIKSLVNDKSITVLKYNEDLANIVADPTDTEVIQAQMIDDVRKLAEKTNDPYLQDRIAEFEKHMDELRRQKEEAEREAEAERKAKEVAERKLDAERKAKEDAERKARDEEEKRKEAETKRKEAEIARLKAENEKIKAENEKLKAEQRAVEEEEKRKKAEKAKKLESLKVEFYKKEPNPDTEALIHHVKNNNSRIIKNVNDLIITIASKKEESNYNYNDVVISSLSNIRKLSQKSLMATNLILGTDLAKADSQKINLPLFIEGYLKNEVHDNIKCHFKSSVNVFAVIGSKLDLALILDNFIKNSVEWNAKNFWVSCSRNISGLTIDIHDDGIGLSERFINNPEEIFDFATSGKKNGTGFGMYLIRESLKDLSATIEISDPVGNKGIHFKLYFK